MKQAEQASTNQNVYVPPSFQVIDLVDTIGQSKGSYLYTF